MRRAAPAPAAPRTRHRRHIEADLRGVGVLRAGIRTGVVSVDERFGEVIARRADRLLDELLRCTGEASPELTSVRRRS